MPLATLTIDLHALRHNLGEVKRCAPNSKILAMLKADAYGHGLLACARALDKADGFAVARIEEAITLRDNGIDKKIVLLNGVFDHDTLVYCARQQIEPVLYDAGDIPALLGATLPSALPLWLKVDTGMHRLGLAPETIATHTQTLQASPHVTGITLMTHFSDAERADLSRTRQQLQLFNNACNGLPGERSLANSAAIIQSPETHADWVRPGIMLYGSTPILDQSTQHNAQNNPPQLRPVMNLHSRILSIREIATGETVGYNGSWTATRNSRIATIAIGYGDGYPRHARNGTPVLIRGRRFPLAGRVSMDLITVDITDAEDLQRDDVVTLWGCDANGNELPANDVASFSGTISYHLFTGVTARVQRCYID